MNNFEALHPKYETILKIQIQMSQTKKSPGFCELNSGFVSEFDIRMSYLDSSPLSEI